jgi:hypothetical protein
MSRRVKAATALAVMLATAIALYGLFVAFVGMPATLVMEYNPIEGTGGEKTIIQYPTPHALLGTLAATMIVFGLLIRKQRIAWIGLATLFAYSAVFLFSTGLGLLPVAVILLILLNVIYSSQKPPGPFWRDPEFYGLSGFILVVSTSVLYFFTYMPMTSLLYLIIGAAVAAWGIYRNTLMAWLGSILVLALSISLMFSAGLLPIVGAVVLLAGAALTTFKKNIKEK